MSRAWTEEQRRAIWDDGGSLLLAAAAGSGKTAVLTQRAVERITDEAHPLPADRLLIVTFTNAAAAELRQRMAAALDEKLAQQPHSGYLKQQRLLLGRASICTVDSFCIDLITRYISATALPADFTIIRAAEETALRADALEQTLETAYADEDFCRFASMYGKARSDEDAGKAVLRLYDITRVMADPEGWWRRLEEAYAVSGSPAATPWGEELLAGAATALRAAAARLDRALALMDGAADFARAAEILRGELAQVQRLAALADAGDWQGCYLASRAVGFDVLRLPSKADPVVKGRIKGLREGAKKLVRDLAEDCFFIDEAGFAAQQAESLPLVRALVAAVRQFAAQLFSRKLEARAFGFDDFEHAALALLRDENGKATPLAEELRGHYAMVMVDEYQDTNDLQEQLFRLLAKEDGANLFYVGDVKQSIYGFREAKPANFIAKQDAWAVYDGRHYPATLRLSCNFRSTPAVIAAVNDIFAPVFCRAVGGVDYAAGEALRPGLPAAPLPAAAEVLLTDTAAGGEGIAAADVPDAGAVANWIAELLRTGAPVRDADTLRPCRPGDFCILLRSPADRGRRYTERLEAMGIGAWCRADDELLADVQVGLLLSFMRVLDNPGQDIHLSALLLSPLFGFTPEDLAAVRLGCREGTLYAALLQLAAQSGAAGQPAAAETADASIAADIPAAGAANGLPGRVAAFLDTLRRLRRRALGQPLGQVCAMLLEETGLYHMAGALPGGESCQQNLRSFQAVCAEYAGSGGIAGFLRLVDAAVQNRRPLSKTRGRAGGGDRVQLMSIHASKGLEFPIVILAGADHRFNNSDANGSFLCHAELGLGFKLADGNTRALRHTLATRAIIARMRRQTADEEMRLLYVALTRAKDRLCVSLCADRPAALLDKQALLVYAGGGRPDAAALADTGQNGMAHWLLLSLLGHPDAAVLREMCGWQDLPLRADTAGRFVFTVTPAAADTGPAGPPARTAPADAALAAALAGHFARRPAPAPTLPVKVSVSALAHRTAAPVMEGPAFLQAAGMTAAGRGTALHRFLQLADLAAAVRDAEAEIGRLVAGGYLEPAAADAIERPVLHRFLQSGLIARMLSAQRLLREYEFISRIPAALVADGSVETAFADAGSVFLLGIADCVLLNGAEAELVDYKTDHGKTPADFLAAYGLQLALYRDAIQQRLGVAVRRSVIYSFALGQEIEVPL